MVCNWTGLRNSKAEVMMNHMDNRQFCNAGPAFGNVYVVHEFCNVKFSSYCIDHKQGLLCHDKSLFQVGV